MQAIRAILFELREAGAVISIEGDSLRIDSEKGAIGDRLKSLIKTHKQGLMNYIREIREDDFLRIPPAPEQACYALSSAQGRIWLLSQLEEASIAYNIPGVCVFEGSLDRSALERALLTLIARHEILRTVFHEDEEGEIRQFIQTPEQAGFRLEYQDLRGEGGTDQIIKEGIKGALGKPFDLINGSLIRAILWQVSEDRWVFAYVMHHIVSDGWSMGVLINELLTVYDALARGKSFSFSPLRLQYKDYAVWQLNRLHTQVFQKDKAYWLRQFEDDLPVLELGGDRSRPAAKSYRGGTLNKEMRPEQVKMIRDLAHEQGGTLFMGLLAVVNTLLFRYTGQQDIIAGTPIAGRKHADLEDQIGFYVNTLALRARFRAQDSFISLLRHIREITLEAFEHQDYPFDELVNDLAIKGNSGRSPLFDIMVVLQNAGRQYQTGPQDMHGIRVSRYEGEIRAISKFDLVFCFEESAGGCQLILEYNTDIYDGSSIERMVGHLDVLMQAIALDPDIALYQLNIISLPERRLLLECFNDTENPSLKNRTVIELFEQQVERTPGKIALTGEDLSFTYKELNERANELGDYLVWNHAITADDLVMVKMERSEWMIVAILAILKAGGAYVPVEPSWPAERIDYMTVDCQCKVVIDNEFMCKADAEKVPGAKRNPIIRRSASSLVYVMYTSGSTGRPKGVMVEQAGIVRLVKDSNYIKLTGDEVLLSTGAASFDAVTFEYWGMLLNGGRLVICRQDVLLDATLLAKEIKERHVNIMWFTSGWLNQLVDTDIDLFRGLKTILAGGDKLSPTHINLLLEKYPSLTIINGYGPTENTTFSLTYRIDRLHERIPVGSPITNTRAYILGERDELMPIGAIGEICLGGDGLARGYLNQPLLTADKFPEDPFRTGERMYKTGDLGKWLPDGQIVFAGRKDDQCKIRGYRIEPAEIEKVLQSHPDIGSAVVIARPVTTEKHELVCYLICSRQLVIADIRGFLRKTLPDYMVPDHFVQLDELPLNGNGKVDRQRLPDPQDVAMPTGVSFVPPRNATERVLVSIWMDILGKDTIGVKDDFFESGGHSLNIAKLVGKIYKELDVKLTVRDLFTCKVLEDQAVLIRQSRKTAFEHISASPIQESYPVSAAQRRMWLVSQTREGSLAYNIPGTCVFRGVVDLAVFNRSLLALSERHEILRTVFREDGQGEPRQYILPGAAGGGVVGEGLGLAAMSYGDLRHEGEKDQIVQRLIGVAFAKPFDLADGPLWRAALYRMDDDRWVFVYVMHHIISDGRSMNVLVHELMQFYGSFVTGEQPLLPPLRIQYKDYAVWQQTIPGEGRHECHKAYWLQQLGGTIPLLEHPGGRLRPPVRTYYGAIVRKTFSPAMSGEFRELCIQLGGTLFMGLVAAVNVLLHWYSRQEEFIIGTPVAGRPHADLEYQIGLYLNTLPLRLRTLPGESFAGLFEKAKQMALHAFEHQEYPFDELIDALDIPVTANRNILFDVWIVLHNTEIGLRREDAGGLRIEPFEGTPDLPCKFDLQFSFSDQQGAIEAAVEYNTDLVGAGEAALLARQLKHVIQYAVDDASQTLLDIRGKLDEYNESIQRDRRQALRQKNLRNLFK